LKVGGKIIKEVKSINEPDKDTVEELEFLLDLAKSGDLKVLGYAYSGREGVVHGWTGVLTEEIIGSLEELKFNFFSQMHFQNEKDD